MTHQSDPTGRGNAVRKNNFFSIIAVAALFFLTLPAVAQEKAKQANAGRLVPAGSHVVLSFNIGSLLKKSGHETFLDLPGAKDAHQELKQESELAAKILENPKLLGIDFDKPIYLFGTFSPAQEEFGEPEIIGGLMATPLSAAKLEAGLKKVFTDGLGEAGAQMFKKLRKEKNYSILADSDGDVPIALAFNDDALVLMGGNSEEALEGIEKELRKVMGGKKVLAKSEATYGAYLKKQVDLGGWINLNSLMKLSPDIPAEQLEKLQNIIGKMRMAGSVNFIPGTIQVDIISSTDAEYVKKIKPAPKKTMLGLLPHKAVASFAYSFDMKGTRKWLKEEYLPALKKMEGGEALAMAELMMMGAIGMNFDDLLDIPKGEMIFSFIDLEMGVDPDFGTPEPKPSLIFGMTVNDQKKLGTLVKKLEDEGGVQAMNAAGFSILRDKDRFFIANNGLIKTLRAGKMPNAVADKRRAFFDENDQAFLLDFKQIVRLAQDFDAPNEVVQVLVKFAEARFQANQKGEISEVRASLSFRDQKTNSLKQLIKLANEIEQDIRGLDAPEGNDLEAVPEARDNP